MKSWRFFFAMIFWVGEIFGYTELNRQKGINQDSYWISGAKILKSCTYLNLTRVSCRWKWRCSNMFPSFPMFPFSKAPSDGILRCAFCIYLRYLIYLIWACFKLIRVLWLMLTNLLETWWNLKEFMIPFHGPNVIDFIMADQPKPPGN